MNWCLVLLLVAVANTAPRADKKTLAFSKRAYVAEYGSDETFTVENVIIEAEDFSKVAVTLEGDHADQFNTSLKDNGSVDFSLSGDLDGISNETVTIVQVVAKEDKKSVSADIFVILPKSHWPGFHFSDNVYKGDYSENDKKLTTDDIQLRGDLEGVQLDADSDDFKPNLDGKGKVTLSYTGESLSTTNNYKTVKITASKSDITQVADIVVKVPKQTHQIFDDNLYFQEYSEVNGEGKLTALSDIKVTADNLTMLQTFSSLPDIVHSLVDNKTGAVTLFILEGQTLPASNNNEIVVTLTAKYEDDSETVDVVLKLPKKDPMSPLHFSSKVYVAEYIEDDDGTGSIKFDSDIEIVDADLSKVEISLDQEIFNATATVGDDGEVLLVWTGSKDDFKDEENFFKVNLTASDDGKNKEEAYLYVVLPDRGTSGALGHSGVTLASLVLSVLTAMMMF